MLAASVESIDIKFVMVFTLAAGGWTVSPWQHYKRKSHRPDSDDGTKV
jgi:hypothetical protein